MERFIKMPYSILHLRNLSLSAKAVLGLIVNLSDDEGVSFASNKYLAETFGFSERCVAKAVKSLREKEYIFCEKHGRKRYITLNREKLNDEKSSSVKGEHFAQTTAKCSELSAKSSDLSAKSAQYNNNYNNKYKNNYYNNKNQNYENFNSKRKSSYNLEELMIIR